MSGFLLPFFDFLHGKVVMKGIFFKNLTIFATTSLKDIERYSVNFKHSCFKG